MTHCRPEGHIIPLPPFPSNSLEFPYSAVPDKVDQTLTLTMSPTPPPPQTPITDV